MTEPVEQQEPTVPERSAQRGLPADRGATKSLWHRLKEHKVAEWTLAYAAFAYTLLHITEMLSEAQDWPHGIVRVVSFVLLLATPLAATLAWYHGAKALRRVTGPELIIITILLVIAGSILWALSRGGSEHASLASQPGGSMRGPVARVSLPPAQRTAVAVMPFVNLTGDKNKEYLGEGMAEEVINALTKVPDLQVPARTSSFAYKGRDVDVRKIAQDLNVGAVLEGSVRSAGSRIRVTAELINAQTGFHMWAQTYDRNFTDLFQLQDDLASAIVQALETNLGLAPSKGVTPAPPTRDVRAYDLYLQGFSLMLRGSEQNLRQALDLFDQALKLDPMFARAYAARSRARLTFLVRGLPLENARIDADRDAEKALALDPSLGVAHQALANVSALEGRWLQAAASYQAALAVDAADADIHSGYAMVVLAPSGHMQQAYAEGKKSYGLAPASPAHVSILATLSLDTGRNEDALRLADLALALGAPSNLQVYVHAAERQTRYTEAQSRVTDALSPAVRRAGGAEAMRLLYAALADPTKRPAAVQALQSVVRTLGPGHMHSGEQRDFMVDFAQLDALDPAYQLAGRYLDEFERSGTGGGVNWSFLWIPEMHPFRRDLRFQAFVERLGLVEYWQQYGPPDGCELRDRTLSCR
jgi:TolB-like protein